MKSLLIVTITTVVLLWCTAPPCAAQGFVLEYEYPSAQVNLQNDFDQFRTPNHYDLDGDGVAEIVMTDRPNPGELLMLAVDGTTHEVVWTYTITDVEYVYFDGFADFDGDGTREVLMHSDVVGTRIVDATSGATIATLPYGYETTFYDYDQDGRPEIQVDSETLGVQIWGWQPANAVDRAPTPSPALAQNRPNPFNPRTMISYQVQVAGRVRLDILDPRGRLLDRLVDASLAPGEYEVVWDGTDQSGRRLASGTYLYQLQVGDFVSARKLVLLK